MNVEHWIVDEPDQVDAELLSRALHVPVHAVVGVDRIGTGQMSRNFRLRLEGEGPGSIVIKIPAADAATREMGAGAYAREVHFYAEVAARIPSGVARCHHHAISDDGTRFLLVLDDLAPARQGDQLNGCTVEEARTALANLAGIHTSVWQHDDVLSSPHLARSESDTLTMIYPLALDEFLRRYRERLAPGTETVLEAFRHAVGTWNESRPGPTSLVHGDYRLDNLLFLDGRVAAVDWQTAAAGPPARDLAYFLGNSLRTPDRRAHEQSLIEHYRAVLARHDIDYPLDDLAVDYARGAWLGPLVTVVGAFVATRTERGDDMFVAMADRAAAQLADWNGVDLL